MWLSVYLRLLVSQRPCSIQTRIKTPASTNLCPILPGQRPCSIQTRIKTRNEVSDCASNNCQRPCSIQTRIKTRLEQQDQRLQYVRDHVPFKQGLRHEVSDCASNNLSGRQRPCSIQTRIKTPRALRPASTNLWSETMFHSNKD